MDIKSLKTSVKYQDHIGSISFEEDHKSLEMVFGKEINDEHVVGFEIQMDPKYINTLNDMVSIIIYTGQVERDGRGRINSRKIPKVKAYKKEISLKDILKIFKTIQVKSFEKDVTRIKVIEEIRI